MAYASILNYSRHLRHCESWIDNYVITPGQLQLSERGPRGGGVSNPRNINDIIYYPKVLRFEAPDSVGGSKTIVIFQLSLRLIATINSIIIN